METNEPYGDRIARTEWLIAELQQRAETCEDPRERTNLKRSADSLLRLVLSLRP